MSLPDLPPRHPLDEALRQQLADYAEAPGPQVWAGVRQRLGRPVPAWRARWRRPLPLLLGLLVLLLATVGQLYGPARRPPLARTGATPGSRVGLDAGLGAGQSGSKAAALRPKPLSARPDQLPDAATGGTSGIGRPESLVYNIQSGRHSQPTVRSRPRAGRRAAAATRAASLTNRVAANRGRQPRRLPEVYSGEPALATLIDSDKPTEIGPARREVAAGARQQLSPDYGLESQAGARLPAAVRQGRADDQPVRLTQLNRRLAAASASASLTRPVPAAATQPGTAGTVTPAAVAVADAGFGLTLAGPEPASPLAPLAPLAYRTVLLAAPRPADSLRPRVLAALEPVRPATARHEAGRWSVQALAGPTLSYRRLPQPETGGAATLAHRERPAAGLGAPVQLRRILSGRWALAAGLGYQQYATRLPGYDGPGAGGLLAPGSATGPGRGQAVATSGQPSRDTYHLLVLPVQLSYALGSAGRPWQLAALAGLEAARYLGGSVTLASPTANSAPTFLPYTFAQRPYSNAQSSPYRPWSGAGSLGLELRYQPTDPGARWQLLVQPTGRYVLTSFARPDAADYSRRPFSLGLLVGAGWRLK